MTSSPVRDPLADHLLTPENAAFLFIDYQPSQLATIRSMDAALLLKNAVSTVRAIKTFGVPVVHSTVNVAAGQGPTLPELAGLLDRSALYGVLAEIDALGLDLLEVRQLAQDPKSLESGDRASPGRPLASGSSAWL